MGNACGVELTRVSGGSVSSERVLFINHEPVRSLMLVVAGAAMMKCRY
jgi:hypothetical protein